MSGSEQDMSAPEAAFPVRFVIGSRQILSVPKQLHTVSFTIDDLADGHMPTLPKLSGEFDGYRVLSADTQMVPVFTALAEGYVIGGRQDYHRHFIDMAGDFEAYLSGFSSKTRSTLRRKQRKLDSEGDGDVEVREYRSPSEIAEFMGIALPLSRRTYQARTLDAGLPEDDVFRAEMMDHAARDALRCYLLYFRGEPISYLCLPIEGDTVIYAYLGYDNEYARLSPGTVLQMQALERLFAEKRYRYFDFTEGDGPHKAQFGNRSVEACSFFLLKSTPGNRVLLALLDMFDAGVAGLRKLAARTGALSKIRRTIRRA